MNSVLTEVAIALVARSNHWLVARRMPDAHLGGLWEFPGGKREAGESAESAAIRELREECGADAAPVKSLLPVEFDYGDRRVRVTPIVCRWTAGEPRALGNAECRWVTLEELQSLQMPAGNEQIIRELREHINASPPVGPAASVDALESPRRP